MACLPPAWRAPVFLAFNFFSAVAIILVNKQIMKVVQFHFPTALTLVHYVVTWLGLWVLAKTGMFTPRAAAWDKQLYLLSVVNALGPMLSNISLRLNSVGFYQMAKIAVLPAIVVLQWYWYRTSVSDTRKGLLAIITAGVIMATVNDVQLNLWGSVAALVLLPTAATYKLLWSHVQKDEGWETLQLMYKVLPLSTVWLLLCIPVLDPPGLLTFPWTSSKLVLVLCSGALAFVINWSAFLVLGTTSALTHVLLGQLKTCVLILGGYLLFNTVPTGRSLLGALVVIVTVVWYTRVNLQEQKATTKAALASPAAANHTSSIAMATTAYHKVSTTESS